MVERRVTHLLTATAMILLSAVAAFASPESAELRDRAAAEIYNLDRDQAVTTYRQAIAADPGDAAAFRGLASALWLSLTFRRGNLTVDDYLGGISANRAGANPPPPQEIVTAFHEALEHAFTLARQRLAQNPNDPDAHYQLGAAYGLRASYTATIEGRTFGAFRAARDAYEEHERVLDLDARRKDAALIVGTYRYVVSVLSLPARWFAYVAGFGGGKERGLHLVEEAAAYAGENQTDARIALILLYNREKRYDDALKVLAGLRERYPKNRLLWLESGSTLLRADRAGDAVRILEEGMTRFDGDTRPRMFGEAALWSYKRGLARAKAGRTQDAHEDLERAAHSEGRKWVLGRAHLELAKLAMKSGDRATASRELSIAIDLCETDNDAPTAAEARRLRMSL